jgi:SAM-dependent methyltransferase
VAAPPPGWPFFAPSPADAIEVALDLADVGPGVRLLDLGCGDGAVLVAAARRGAVVRGIECDAALARAARAGLADEGLPGTVVHGDLYSALRPDPDGRPGDPGVDVVFTYLSPASLQRLAPALAALQPALLVTLDFAVPGLVADAHEEGSRLYRLPGRRRRAVEAATGWAHAGTLCVMPPEVESLTCLEMIHPGGPVDLRPTGGLVRHAAIAHGTDDSGAGGTVAIDIRWRERDPGTLAAGTLVDGAAGKHPVTVLFAEDDQGQWDLSRNGVAGLAARLRRRSLPRPTTTRELLAAARGH